MVNRVQIFLILILCLGYHVSALPLAYKSPKVNDYDILSNIGVTPGHDSIKKEEVHPYNYRPLTARDSAVYRMIDSLERADERDKAMRSMEAFISGNISYLIFNIDYRRFLNYNPHEGLRLGLGLSTNQKLASFFSVGGYCSYGIKDEDWKYGSFIQLFPKWQSDTRLTFKYMRDVSETGGYSFFEDHFFGSTEWFRNFLINQMDFTETKEGSITFRFLHSFKINLCMSQSHKIPKYVYEFEKNGYNGSPTAFNFTEAGLNIKFCHQEKFMQAPSGQRLSLGSKYPVIWFNVKRGLNLLQGNFVYNKYELKITKGLTTKPFGKSQITITAGFTDGNIPLPNLYNGHGNYSGFSIHAENSFATMRMNEFFSSEFASFYFIQNFGKLFHSKSIFSPELCFATNAGYGRMKNPQYQQYFFNTLEKGYYESGILVINTIKMGFLGYGFGVYYRYGPYSFERISANFAYKLSLSMSL
jgi:hypothetical protein